MRAALLPTPGNPFLIEHWLRNYEQVWAAEVDELRVLVNAQPDPAICNTIRDLVERRGGIYMEDDISEHGLALHTLISATEADTLLLCEDDCRVRIPGQVSERFARIEASAADVIGSPRGSMTRGVEDAAKRRFPAPPNTDDTHGDHGRGMWPAFVFARRAALLSTDQQYGVREWLPGEHVLGLPDHIPTVPEYADTFGATALQLHDNPAIRVESDVQFKGPGGWHGHLRNGTSIPWFHIGSLSSWRFNGEAMHTLPVLDRDKPQWSHRFAWWRRVEANTPDNDTTNLDPFRGTYREAWEAYRAALRIGPDLIDSWTPLLDEMVTWDEARG